MYVRDAAADNAIAGLFRAGDPEVVHRVLVSVRAVIGARGYFIPPCDRADVVQETLIGLWKAVDEQAFDSEESFFAFVREVAHRRSVDWVRRHRTARQHLAPLTPEVESRPAPVRPADARLLGDERVALAGHALRSLGDSCRDLICRHVRDGLSYAEIASATGRTEGALRVQMVECIRSARKVIDRLASRRRA